MFENGSQAHVAWPAKASPAILPFLATISQQAVHYQSGPQLYLNFFYHTSHRDLAGILFLAVATPHSRALLAPTLHS